MKKSVFLSLLFVFSLLSLSALKEKSDTVVPVSTGKSALSGFFNFPTDHDNSVIEVSPPAVPGPMRTIRKAQEELQMRGYRTFGAYSLRYISFEQYHLSKATEVSVSFGGNHGMLSHDADYLKFGILII